MENAHSTGIYPLSSVLSSRDALPKKLVHSGTHQLLCSWTHQLMCSQEHSGTCQLVHSGTHQLWSWCVPKHTNINHINLNYHNQFLLMYSQERTTFFGTGRTYQFVHSRTHQLLENHHLVHSCQNFQKLVRSPTHQLVCSRQNWTHQLFWESLQWP